MRLHILPDEKIINRTIDIFEHVFPMDNKYIILASKCRYVDVNKQNVYVVQYGTGDFWRIVGDVSSYSSIVIHYLSNNAADFINKINHHNIYWIEWGGDLYNNLLYPKGYKLYTNNWIAYRNIYPNIFSAILHYIFIKRPPRSIFLKAIKKIRYFVPDSMFDEYPLLLNYYPEFSHLAYKPFFYYPIDQVIAPELRNRICHGRNIVVGHSCSVTGNHIEVIDILSSLNYDFTNQKIIFPLSYAGNDNYRKKIVDIGSRLLGESFFPIIKFLELDEYNELLLSSSVFIYNNYRQEAVGNILVALYFGGKVFLSSHSPLLKYYKSLGLHIYSISDLNSVSISGPLSNIEQSTNRRIIEQLYSVEQLYSIVKHHFL